MVSAFAFTVLVALVGAERIAELVLTKRHARWGLARGGVEYGRSHYPPMVICHTGLLAGAVAEVWLAGRPLLPALAATMLALTLAAQALRWWCIRALGPYWNTRVIVVPGAALVGSGPYRWLRHPNYVAVVIEGIALPLVHTAWLTALCFTVVNAALLAVRVRVENAALTAAGGEETGRAASEKTGGAASEATGNGGGTATGNATGNATGKASGPP